MDFWTHHYRSLPFRLESYSKVLDHPETLDELESLSKPHNSEAPNKINDLLELSHCEETLISITDDFEATLKKAESHEELDDLKNKI